MPVDPNAHIRTVPTVKVQANTELGFMIINKSDFDEKKHKKYIEPPKQPEQPAKKKAKGE